MAILIYLGIVLAEMGAVDVPDWIRFVAGFIAVIEAAWYAFAIVVALVVAFMDRS